MGSNSTRRNFLQLLAAIPLVGRAFAAAPATTQLAGKTWTVTTKPGLVEPGKTYYFTDAFPPPPPSRRLRVLGVDWGLNGYSTKFSVVDVKPMWFKFFRPGVEDVVVGTLREVDVGAIAPDLMLHEQAVQVARLVDWFCCDLVAHSGFCTGVLCDKLLLDAGLPRERVCDCRFFVAGSQYDADYCRTVKRGQAPHAIKINASRIDGFIDLAHKNRIVVPSVRRNVVDEFKPDDAFRIAAAAAWHATQSWPKFRDEI